MSGKMEISKLSDIADVIDSLHKTPKYSETGYPMVRCTDVKYGRLKLTDTLNVDREIFAEFSRRYKPQENDILITRVGSYGITALVGDNNFCLGQNTSAIVAKINPRYLYLALNSPQVKNQIEFSVVGSTQKTLSLKAINNLEIPRFGEDIEKKIASIIGDLDNKIELNHQTNQTLEQISQAIFKNWFIDFEPVKAKEHLRKLGGDSAQIERAAQSIISGAVNLEDIIAGSNLTDLDNEIQSRLETKLGRQTKEQQCKLAETAKLFPDKLVESKLGVIPEGWRTSTIGEEVNVVGGGTPSTKDKEFWENGTINWTTPRDLSKISDKVLLNTDRKITKQGLTKISSGLLPVNTVLLSSRAPVGYLSLTKIPVAINQGYIAMKCEKILSPEFVLQWANSIMNEIKQRASGTTFAEISKKNFRLIPVLVPSPKIVNSFTLFNSGFYEQISKNVSESNILTNLRDSLLPKLLSGEIFV